MKSMQLGTYMHHQISKNTRYTVYTCIYPYKGWLIDPLKPMCAPCNNHAEWVMLVNVISCFSGSLDPPVTHQQATVCITSMHLGVLRILKSINF